MSSKGKSSEIYAISLKNRDVKEMLEEGSQGKLLIIIGLFVIAIIGVALYGQWQISQDNDKILTLTNTIIQMYHNATKITLVKP
jgi:Tfp pilus assembly protein PilN